MRVVNQSKNTSLSDNLKGANSFSDRIFGLLKKSNPRCLMFKTRLGVHTFFIKNPIDVIVLDVDFKVVKRGMVKPNNLFFWNPKHSLVLELPRGTIKKTKTEIGNHLKITP